MSKAILEYDTILGIANTIRSKIPEAGKMRVSDMSALIDTLHGYKSTARVLSAEPVSFPLSVFALSDMGTATATAAKNANYSHRETRTVFDITNSLSFTTKAARAE